MGNLLGAPVTDKETHTGEIKVISTTNNVNPSLKWGMSSMQGWRVHMEDAHICETKLYAIEPSNNEEEEEQHEHDDDDNNSNKHSKIYLPDGHALFAVFDGHGGTFSAMYSGRNFCRILSKQTQFIQYTKLVTSIDNHKSYDPNTKPIRMNLLEQALQQAFVETDYEIGLAIRGNPHPHANQEYHTPQDEEQHQQQQQQEGSSTMENAKDQPVDNDNDGDDDDDVDMTDPSTPHTMRDAASRVAHEHAAALDDDGDSGTTACMVLITPEAYVCANAGDSRAVFSRKANGTTVHTNPNMMHARQAVALSYDHKPDDEPEERRIRSAGGYVAGGRVEGDLAVSRGLGDFRFKSMATVLNNTQLLLLQSTTEGQKTTTTSSKTTKSNTTAEDDDTRMEPSNDHDANDDTHVSTLAVYSESSTRTATQIMAPGDQKVSPIPDILVQSRNYNLDEFVIVACDGIWDVRTNQECVTEVATMFSEGETHVGLICEELLDTCLRLGSKDNMTAIVVQLPGQDHVLSKADNSKQGVMGRRKQREEHMKAQQEADEDGSQQNEDYSSDEEGGNEFVEHEPQQEEGFS